jgi:ABC-type nitrate/sulfonate/bicarbonate transport system permease component
MYAALLVVAVLGFLVDRLIKVITQRMLAWQDTKDPI